MTDPAKLPFMKLLSKLEGKRSLSEVFRTFVGAAACAYSYGTREAEYLSYIKGYGRAELDVLCSALGQLVLDMELHEYEDLLGPAYMAASQGKFDRQAGGEFYTPQALSDLCARMTFDPANFPINGPLLVSEPSGGSGGMILSLLKVMRAHDIPPGAMRVELWDISRVATHMAFVNFTLWGIPAEIVHGNTLSLEVFSRHKTFRYYDAHGWAPAQAS